MDGPRAPMEIHFSPMTLIITIALTVVFIIIILKGKDGK